MRPVYFLLGWCFFGLGAAGTVVPGLPTTPFMLLALWAFSKSSQRFHDWLYAHRVFGPPLRQWRNHRVIPGKAKLLAIATMSVSLVYLTLFTDAGIWVKALIALLMLYGAVFILSKPSRVAAPGSLPSRGTRTSCPSTAPGSLPSRGTRTSCPSPGQQKQ